MLTHRFSFFAIVGLLASQLAAMPHAHPGMTAKEQQAHAAKPHFHTGKHGHRHGSHQHGGHSHRHHQQPANQGTNEPFPHEGAVHCVPDIDVVLVSKTTSFDGNQVSCPLAEVVAAISTVSPHFSRHWRPPDDDWQASQLYLSLRNLRL